MHNTRSPEQWNIISKHVDFKDKTVLDLGAGYGDLLFKFSEARKIYAVDKDTFPLHKRIAESDLRIKIYGGNIDDMCKENPPFGNVDIIICFSVLPYLSHPFTVLEWIKEHSQIALIECQYFTDGPGSELIKNDNDMRALLSSVGWQSIEAIGKTLVEGRNKYRTIWRCIK